MMDMRYLAMTATLLQRQEKQAEIALGWLQTLIRETESSDSPAFVAYELLTRLLVYKDQTESFRKLKQEYIGLSTRIRDIEKSLDKPIDKK